MKKTPATMYYARQSAITDPGRFAYLFDELPDDVLGVARTLWGVVLHPATAEHLGIDLSPERRAELDLRSVLRMLARMLELDPRPLTEARPPERKLVGNCRDSAVLLCSILRHRGISARPRAGFATYFDPGFHGDHWICEVWREDEARWVMVDADLPPDWTGDIDPFDVPVEGFLVAGHAWQRCRAGQADPKTFGLPELPHENGMGWIGSQVVRDLACLNRAEMLCWDRWALGATVWRGYSDEEAELLDRVADLTTAAGNERFEGIRALHEGDGRLTVPSTPP